MSRRLATKIEAILYLKGKLLSLAEIAECAGCDREATAEALIELMEDYARRDSALEVVETNGGYALQLREAYQDIVQTLVPLELGTAALRTLAAIALSESILQSNLVDLRGSGAYQHVQELVRLGFVRRRPSSDGRSYILQVTEKFHHYFQLDDLPGFSKEAAGKAKRQKSAKPKSSKSKSAGDLPQKQEARGSDREEVSCDTMNEVKSEDVRKDV